MKPHTTKLIGLLAIFAAVLFAPFATAQSLLPSVTEGQRIAQQIDAQQVALVNHIEMQLNTFHRLVNTAGKQQEILDALGTNAGVALQRYVAMRTVLLQLKPTASTPAPDPKVFVVNKDGTVTYVAPPAPVKVETPTRLIPAIPNP